jgi:hypothetical protein
MSLEVEVVVVVVICVVIVVFLYGRSFHKTSLSIFSKFNKMSESSFSQDSEIGFFSQSLRVSLLSYVIAN